MNVLLITPVTDRFSCRWIPLGPGYMSAVLKANGHDVLLFDRTREYIKAKRSLDVLDQAMLQTIRTNRPDIIAFGTVTPTIYDTVRCAEMIRREYQGIMVAGGHHASALPALTLQRIPQLDAVVAGEGENALKAIADKGLGAKIPGVLWRDRPDEIIRQAELIADGPGSVHNLDELPYPDLSIYDMDYYLCRNLSTIRGFYLKTISLLTSRGCLYKCGFCSESLTFGKGVRYNSPEYVLEMIDYFQQRYDFEAIYFHDNDFLSDPQRAERICELLAGSPKHSRLKWCMQTRVTSVTSLKPGVLNLFKKAGCIKVEMGIESASQNQLDTAGKNLNLDQVESAVKLCRQAGIQVHGYFIALMPGETLQDLRQIIENVQKYRLDSFQISNLALYPGTRFYEQYGHKYFEEQSWDKESVRAFFNSDFVSRVSPEERSQFERNCVRPLMKRLHRRALLANNNFGQIIRYVIERKENARREGCL